MKVHDTAPPAAGSRDILPLSFTAFHKGRLALAAHVVGIALLVAVPFLLSAQPFVLRVFSQIYLAVTVVLGFFIILGLSKQFSLAQVAIYGAGAYSMALLTSAVGLNFLPALVLSALIGATLGALVAIPGARFRGPWLALVTFAFAEIARILMARMKTVTGGAAGYRDIPRPSLFGWEFRGEFEYYFLFLAVALFAYWLSITLKRSPYGRIWLALGDNPDIVASTGINVFRHRILAFACGSLLSGLAGAAFASYSTFISPESFGFSHTIYHLTILVVGGLESLAGSILSAILFVFLHNYLMALHPWDVIIDGVVIILCMNFLPEGIGGVLAKVRRTWTRGRRS
jgi:branched-chain amino acid transport system permease protein